MSVAAELGLRVDDPSRVVYVREGTGPCLLDAWATTTGLGQRLAAVQEIVLLDPLSFPYERLTAAHRAVPMTVLLPADEQADDLVALLGDPLLQHLTPEDRVVGPAHLLDELGQRGAWGPVEVMPLEDGEDALECLHRVWREERVVTTDAAFGRFTGYRDDLITRHVVELGAHQRSDLAMLLSTVRPGDTVLDVGAHVGAFAVPLARACGPEGSLAAFEANPASVELLEENLAQNDIHWATVHHAVVGDRSGIPIRSVAGAVGNTGAATADRVWDGRTSLHTVALDDWWQEAGRPQVDVVKLDVEGHELLALQGAQAMLEAHHPVLVLEVAEEQLAGVGTASEALFGFLGRLGYRFHVNALERNRDDDRFELQALDPSDGLNKVVEDVLCTVDDERLRDVG